MILATKTMQAIEEALYKDQGATYRGFLEKLMPLAGDAFSTKNEDWRNHLGASLIGRECAREVWYGFHWATLTRFDGRMLRLFNRGHLEEPRFVALLMTIGCLVWQVDENGKQFRITGHMGHFGGSMDGVALGIPDLPNQPVLTEFKTHNDKSFAKLIADGVQSAKWEHFVQMQIYMGKNKLTWALYMAVNKNDDSIHAELIQFDANVYNRYLERSVMVIEAVNPPPKISQTPGWFKCKFCDHSDICHKGAVPIKHCRTCEYSRPVVNGEWVCGISAPLVLSPAQQRIGCKGYTLSSAFSTK